VKKQRDANDLVRDGKPLDPESSEALLTCEVDANAKCAGLDLDLSEKGSVQSTQRNAVTLLSVHPRWSGVVGYDLRADAAVFLRRPPAYVRLVDVFPRAITDADRTAVTTWLTRQTGAEFADHKVHRAIDFVAREHAFDPLTTYDRHRAARAARTHSGDQDQGRRTLDATARRAVCDPQPPLCNDTARRAPLPSLAERAARLGQRVQARRHPAREPERPEAHLCFLASRSRRSGGSHRVTHGPHVQPNGAARLRPDRHRRKA
jgi:hypothetical protein